MGISEQDRVARDHDAIERGKERVIAFFLAMLAILILAATAGAAFKLFRLIAEI